MQTQSLVLTNEMSHVKVTLPYCVNVLIESITLQVVDKGKQMKECFQASVEQNGAAVQ